MPQVKEQYNTHWNLESFLDSMIIELDKARETLALKAINKPLTYAVKDISMDLQLFPSYNGDNVQFITAQPGQSGASKVSIQLGSITDQQVRETSKLPVKNDVRIETIEGLDDATKKNLKKIGVSTIKDVEKIERKNVDLQSTGPAKISYKDLTGMIEKARRAKNPPVINKVSLSENMSGPLLELSGRNLSVAKNYTPVVVINNQLAEVLSHQSDGILVKPGKDQLSGKNEIVVTLDPFAIFKMNINVKNWKNEI